MPLTLATRIGHDTLGKMELAARRRYAEASRLKLDEPLGAIYLFGYTIEMRLKAAYFRIVGLIPTSPLAASRPLAEAQIRILLGLRGQAVGHNLYGWAKLLEHTRAITPSVAPMPTALQSTMYSHVQNVGLCWTEVLRYRANAPYDEELDAVHKGAKWFKVNFRRLWS